MKHRRVSILGGAVWQTRIGMAAHACAACGSLDLPVGPPAAPLHQGDTFNLVGCLLKGDQLPTVVFTAQYFICVDSVMMVQYL